MRDERAAPHEAWEGDAVVAPPVCATGWSLIARGCLSGATPWTSAVPFAPGRNGLNARQMAVWSPLRATALCRHVHRE